MSSSAKEAADPRQRAPEGERTPGRERVPARARLPEHERMPARERVPEPPIPSRRSARARLRERLLGVAFALYMLSVLAYGLHRLVMLTS